MVRTLLYLLLFLNCFTAYCQQLRPPVSNFTPKNYGTSQTPENYCVFQDSRGYIFAGNSAGIIMYDGRSWEFIEVQSGSYVTAIDEDKNGTIYVGTSGGEFGKLIVLKNGKLKYVSLLKRFNKLSSNLGWIQRVYTIEKNVYVFTPDALYYLTDKKVQSIGTETSFQLIFKCENKIYAREREVGLIELNGTGKKILSQINELKNYGVFGVVKYNNNELMIVTKEKGLWTYNLKNKQTLCLTPDSIALKKYDVFGGIKLHDGNFALNSFNSGVLILNSSGKIISMLNKASGLRVNDVKQIIQDKHHNLWLALSNGIGLINYGSFLHYYDDETGLLGGTECVMRLKNQIYVGTSEGLFTEKINDPEKHFIQINDIHSQVWEITSDGNLIYVATSNGVYKGGENKFSKIFSQNVNTLAIINNNSRLLAAGKDGVYLLDTKTGKLINETYFEQPVTRCLSLKIDPASTPKKTICWLGTVGHGIIKIEIENDNINHTSYQNLEDRALTFTRPAIINNQMYFCTASGLRKLVPEKDGSVFFDFAQLLPGLDTLRISDIRQTGKRIWVCVENKISHFDENKKQVSTPFMPIDMGRINNLYTEDQNSCWIAAADGLVKYTQYYNKKYNQDFEVVLRKVILNNDSVYFYGNWKNNGDIKNLQPSTDNIALDYKFNTYEFTVSALFFEAMDKIEFSHMLEGHESEWSLWSSENKIKYTNLREGTYILHVKARNVYGYESKDSIFKFRVKPPWYRTITAYIIYAILAIAIFIFTNRLLSYRLKQKNIQLEEIVKKRTQEINEQYIEIRHQKQEITDSINYAQKIQEAMLPFAKELKIDIPESFVLFKPKDIVSGDFYWYGKYDKKMVIICADCTGHGVPGAFMSMLCVDKLNQIIPEKKILMPDKILEAANKGIKKSLGQSDEQNLKTKDGMDVAIVTLDLEKNKLYYAGANRSLWRIRENEITEFKADKCAVGGFTPEEKIYTLHEVEIKKEDRFYMSTDGYADQFGGPKGKKIMVKAMKEIVLNNYLEPMAKQSEALNTFVEDWKNHPDGENAQHEQVDDICVIGFRI
jgi:serine phosphatase RsbU (regulator of sigma subunit)/ligand-binding sensor domain-containing protein